METVDAAHMRAMNCSILLKLIWKHHRISRADISRMTSMSRSTVSAIVAELMERGLVKELGIGQSSGGRRPMMLAFQEDAFSILGLQVSTHGISAATLNLNGVVRRWVTQPCEVFADPAAAFELVRKMIDDNAGAAFREQMPLIGMALAYPASSSIDFGVWEKQLQTHLTIPVHFDSDAHFGALAELWWNRDAQPRQIAYFQMSEMLGFGLLIRNDLQSFGVNANLGKLLLETGGSIYSMQDMVGESSARPEGGNLAAVLQAAGAGDEAAEAWVDRAAVPVALTLYNAQALLQLDRVVIGGLWRSQAARLKFMVEGLEEQFGRVSPLPVSAWLAPSFRGEQQVALGAGTRILETLLEDISLFPAKVADLPT